jgi:hypothetical protein
VLLIIICSGSAVGGEGKDIVYPIILPVFTLRIGRRFRLTVRGIVTDILSILYYPGRDHTREGIYLQLLLTCIYHYHYLSQRRTAQTTPQPFYIIEYGCLAHVLFCISYSSENLHNLICLV